MGATLGNLCAGLVVGGTPGNMVVLENTTLRDEMGGVEFRMELPGQEDGGMARCVWKMPAMCCITSI